jgi:hypothetical protein
MATQHIGFDDLYTSTLVGAAHGTEGHDMAAALSLFRGVDEEPAREFDDPLNPIIDDSLLDRIAASKGWAKRTKAEYRTNFRQLEKWWSIQHRSTTPMRARDLTGENLAQFVAWRLAEAADSTNAGRVHNKAVEQLSCILKWCMHHDQGYIDSMPRLPAEQPQRDEAGIFFLADDEIDRIYWATFRVANPKGWTSRLPVGAYLRCGLVLFWNLALDTQTVAPYEEESERFALRRSDFFFSARSPSRQMPIESPHGWLWTTRNKTGKDFERAMNREMAEHVRIVMEDDPYVASLLMSSGGRRAWTYRPNSVFQRLCSIAKIEPKIDRQTRRPKKWNLKDLRKTSGAMTEMGDYSPAADMLGHSDSKVTYTHDVSGNIRASIAVMRQRQPASFRSVWDNSIQPPGMLFAK